jgi:hypothetical protein
LPAALTATPPAAFPAPAYPPDLILNGSAPARKSNALALSVALGGILLFLGAGVGLAIFCFSADPKTPGDDHLVDKDKKDRDKPPGKDSTGHDKNPVLIPEKKEPPWLPKEKQKEVDRVIENGKKFLKNGQMADGSWRWENAKEGNLGCTAMAGLTLLECGVAKTDAQIQKAVAYVRDKAKSCTSTYELSVAILFLERLGDNADRPLVQKLAYQLMAGQKGLGGWDYTCALLPQEDQNDLHKRLSDQNPDLINARARVRALPFWQYHRGQKIQKINTGWEDNSLTQFAILALWKVQKYAVKPNRALTMAEGRFRSCQEDDGTWGYSWGDKQRKDSMTCAGLLGLAIGRGIDPMAGGGQKLTDDQAVKKAFAYLAAKVIGKEPVRKGPGRGDSSIIKADAWGDLYCMWSLERVAMIFNLREIGGKKWYPWGADVLIKTQNADGQWCDSFPGVVDTCFALLFLKRANLAKDLTAKLQGST